MRRGILGLMRVSLTLAVIAGAVALGITGYGVLSARASEAAADAPAPAPRTTVTPAVIRIEASVRLPRRFTGQFEAAQQVALGFEEGGTIDRVLVREGDVVAAGAVIARLDTRLLTAERTRLHASRDALAAQAELAQRTNDRQSALLADGHVTQQRIDETSLLVRQLEAQLAEIDAALAALDVRLSKTEIRAPFAGQIGARLMDDGAVAAPGARVVTLLEDAPARFRVALDPALAARLVPGATVEIMVAGVSMPARLSELVPELDAATRSRIAYFALGSDSMAPPARSTGDILLMDELPVEGAWVPLSALRQGPRGSWTLLTVVKESDGVARIAMEAAEVLHLDEGRAFVRGTFTNGTLYLPGGTHRVVPGEAVRIAEAG